MSIRMICATVIHQNPSKLKLGLVIFTMFLEEFEYWALSLLTDFPS